VRWPTRRARSSAVITNVRPCLLFVVRTFCEECATPRARTCSNCGTALSATAKFCHACAHPVAVGAGTPTRSPDSYTPRHLAEKMLRSKAAREGESKQVTVLFADLKGSMELLADRDLVNHWTAAGCLEIVVNQGHEHCPQSNSSVIHPL
jgi:zinc ribbon protein